MDKKQFQNSDFLGYKDRQNDTKIQIQPNPEKNNGYSTVSKSLKFLKWKNKLRRDRLIK